MTTKPSRLVALALAGALVFGACSEGPEEDAAENPQQAFDDAVEALAEYEGLTFTLTVEAGADDLVAADIPEDAAEKVANSSVTVSSKGATSPEDQQARIAVDIDGNEDAVEMLMVSGSIYARADVGGIVEAFGGNLAEIEQTADAFAAQGFEFAQAALDGEWVGIEGFTGALEQFTGQDLETGQAEAAELTDQVTGILQDNAHVTSEGTDDVGAHLVVHVPMRETVQELFEAIQGFSGAPATISDDELAQIPDGDMPIDAWVDDGRLVQLEFDTVAIAEELGEEAPEGVDELALRLTLEEFTDDIEAPADFVPIDLQEVFGGLFGGIPGSTGSSGSATAPREVVIPELGLACTDLEGLPPAQIEQFLKSSGQPGAVATVKKECPELFQ